MELSARNQLKAKIHSIELGDIVAEITLDIAGQQITSVITRASAERLGLKVGDDVAAIIKSTEVMIGK